MTVLIVLGYVAWIAATLWLASLPLSFATMFTMDSESPELWVVAWFITVVILGGSGFGLYLAATSG